MLIKFNNSQYLLKEYPKDDLYAKLYILIASYHCCRNVCILTSVDSDEPVQPPFKLRNTN